MNGDPSTSAAGGTATGIRDKDEQVIREDDEEEDKEEKDKDDRRRRRLGAPDTENVDDTPDVIKNKYHAIRKCLEEMTCADCLEVALFDYQGEGRIIHDDNQGEACEFNLGDDYTMQVHKLLVR